MAATPRTIKVELDLSGLIAGLEGFRRSVERVRQRVEELALIVRLEPAALARGEVLCPGSHAELVDQSAYGACPSCRAIL